MARRVRQAPSAGQGQPSTAVPSFVPKRRSWAATKAGTRRTSDWGEKGKAATRMTMGAAKSAGNALGRWFGVVGDAAEMEMQHTAYNRRRATVKKGLLATDADYARRRSKFAPSAAAMAQATDIVWGDSDEELEEEDMKLLHQSMQQNKNRSDNYDKAMAHYRGIRVAEREKGEKPNWLGFTKNNRRKSVAELFEHRTAHMGPKRQHKRKARRQDTVVRRQLEALPTFNPNFIYLISLLQAILALGIFAHAYNEGEWAPFGFDKREQCALTGNFICPEAFDGAPIVNFTRVEEGNILAGPTSKYLLSVGGMFAACMRQDTEVLNLAAQEREETCGTSFLCDGGASGFACCTLATGRKGMTSEAECLSNPGAVWSEGVKCNNELDFIVIRPCCAQNLNSKCEHLTESACVAGNGQWQQDDVLCADVNCLGPLCQLRTGSLPLEADPVLTNQPDDPNQWPRFFTAIFLHAGILQLIANLVVQLYAGSQIEKHAGFLRTALIYFISGVGGYAVSGIFSPGQVNMGADPAVFGLLGVLVVELFQSWPIVPKPLTELSKLLGIIFVLFFVGTLPFIDNWSHVGGFFFGVVSSIIFLPYITFGKWDLARKKILLLIAMPLLVVMLILAFVIFYEVQNTQFCSWCQYLNCIPYTSDIDCDQID